MDDKMTDDLISRANALALAPGFPVQGFYKDQSPEKRAALNAVAAYQNAIRALPAHDVGVRELEWRRQSVDCEVAETAFGSVAVQNESHALNPNRWGRWMVGSDEDDSPTGYEDGVETAKAAAQADYAARIRSALTATPAADVAGLVDAAKQMLIEYDEVDLDHAEPPSMTAAVSELRAALARMKEAKE